MSSRDPRDFCEPLWGGADAPRLRQVWGSKEERLAWRRYWLAQSLSGLWDLGMHYALRLLPTSACSSIGGRLGSASAKRNHPDWHARAVAALEALRPDLGKDERGALIAKRWGNLGRTMAEFSVLDRLWSDRHLTIEGAENLMGGRDPNQPVIVAAVHLGNWELILNSLTELRIPYVGIYQPPRNRFRHYLAVRARMRAGIPLLPPWRSGAFPAVEALRQGKAVFLGIDEFTGGRVHAPFFGRPVEARGNISNAVRMARLTGARIVPTWCERHEGTRFTVHFEPEVLVDDIPHTREGLLAGVRRLDEAITPIVRANLGQWLMLHELRFDR